MEGLEQERCRTPKGSLKEPDSSELWTEVVKKGKDRYKKKGKMIGSNHIKGGFWNIRWLNKVGRMKCLTDFINRNNLDFIGVQETKKATIESSYLEGVSRQMEWNYVPAKGTAGGILVGFKSSLFEIISWQGFECCAVAIVKNRMDKVVWRLITVYGSPYEGSKLIFLEELEEILANWQGPPR
jgi:hypothetical protein